MQPGRKTALLALVLLAVGCHRTPRVVPFTPPLGTRLAPADDPCGPLTGPPSVAMATPVDAGPFDFGDSQACPMRRPRNIVAFSGGGAYGAYAAGFMAGWTRSGTRPEFDVVTGVSTGSLIAPFAFLGPEYDSRLGRLYTGIRAKDIFRIHTWVVIPFKDSVATSHPLRSLIESQINPALMEAIAAEHRKGRRLYVGTTNLDTRRLVVWDMGAIACRPGEEGCRLFRDVLLASCSVPGILPPVKFELDVDGNRMTELHADGGVTAQMFVPSHVFARAAAPDAKNAKPEPGNLYAVVAGKLYPEASPVKAKVLPVLGASAAAMIYSYSRADLSNLYGQARAAGLNYHLTALQSGFQTLDNSVDFDQAEMLKLFDEGNRNGGEGPAWMSGPPSINPGDGDYIRSGLKLRRVEGSK